MNALVELQRSIFTSISGILSAFAVSRDFSELVWILPLGVVFGAIHAMTPGHGKAILASYLASSRHRFSHGILVAVTLAATHIISAVLIAVTAAPLLTRTLGGVGRAPLLEQMSTGALVAFGTWFVLRAARGVQNHSHREGVWIGFVTGLVPCPLTLFVMFFSISRSIPIAGLAFSAAMLLGVAATLVSVAILAFTFRQKLAALVSSYGTSIDTIARGLDALGGALLIALGLWGLLR